MQVGEIFLYVMTLVAMMGVILYSDVLRKWYSNQEDRSDYHMIRTYLLNQSPLYGDNKPKLWVHTKYEINARTWQSFQSRTTTNLNQPYIHLTVQSVVNMCGDDFHVCLIDDDTFGKLIPGWKVDVRGLAEPHKSHMRQVGLLTLLYYYGGLVVPDSFVCMRPLKPLYERAIQSRPFVAERLNRSCNVLHENKQALPFLADPYFTGAKKNDPVIQEYIDFLQDQNQVPHFSSEHDFLGNTSWWIENAVREGRVSKLDGSVIGIKDKGGEPILMEHLLGEAYLDLDPHIFGIYIPEDEILKRTAYQWFSVMPREQILDSRMIVAKYLAASMTKSSVKQPFKSLDAVERVVVL